jgi:hypothetical protein
MGMCSDSSVLRRSELRLIASTVARVGCDASVLHRNT